MTSSASRVYISFFLKINESNCIKFKIESKLEDENPGGFNIFGKGSGDFQQDIEMNVIYVNKEKI